MKLPSHLLGVAIAAGLAAGCGVDNKPAALSIADVEAQKPGESLRAQNEALRRQNGVARPAASAPDLAAQNAALRRRGNSAPPGRR